MKDIQQIIQQAKSKLIDHLKQFDTTFNINDIYDHSIWQTDVSLDFNFFKLIKGFIPASFSKLLYDITNKVLVNMEFMRELLNFITKEIFDKIWKQRCADMIDFERIMGITEAEKKQPSKGLKTLTTTNQTLPNFPTFHRSLYLEWINKAIEVGFTWMDFHIFLN